MKVCYFNEQVDFLYEDKIREYAEYAINHNDEIYKRISESIRRLEELDQLNEKKLVLDDKAKEYFNLAFDCGLMLSQAFYYMPFRGKLVNRCHASIETLGQIIPTVENCIVHFRESLKYVTPLIVKSKRKGVNNAAQPIKDFFLNLLKRGPIITKTLVELSEIARRISFPQTKELVEFPSEPKEFVGEPTNKPKIQGFSKTSTVDCWAHEDFHSAFIALVDEFELACVKTSLTKVNGSYANKLQQLFVRLMIPLEEFRTSKIKISDGVDALKFLNI